MGKLAVTGAVSWLLGAKIHSGRVAKKLKAKHQKEQKQLYSQYYNDVYKLTEQKNHFESQTEQLKELVELYISEQITYEEYYRRRRSILGKPATASNPK